MWPGYKRDFVGYGRNPPNADWPNKAKVAVSFVLNYEGAEMSIENGDATSEVMLSEQLNAIPQTQRDPRIESDYDYGSRRGVWRIMDLFKEFNFPLTFYAVGLALEKNPEVAKAMPAAGEVASHAYRWIHYKNMPADEEKKLVVKQLDLFRKLYGKPPGGWYYGRCGPMSREIVAKTYKEQGVPLLYDSDSYGDDIPYWEPYPGSPGEGLLIIPYSFDTNDMKFHMPNGFNNSDDFYIHMKNAFDTLYAEAEKKGNGAMMSIGLHCRVIGKPSRLPGLRKFLEYIADKDAWVTTREEIAKHWIEKFPYKP